MSEINIIHENNLTVDAQALWADALPMRRKLDRKIVSPDELASILSIGGAAIRNAIEALYQQNVINLASKGYTISRPSIWVAQLGINNTTDRSKIHIEDEHYQYRGVNFDKNRLQPIIYPHWEAVETAQFYPHVRESQEGTWLMLRDEEGQ